MTTCSSCFNVTTNCTCTVQMISVQTPTPTVVSVGQGQGGARGPQGIQGPAGSGTQGIQGTQGLLGIQGTQGIQGPVGATQEIAYIHMQGTSSDTWTITHNLNFYPNVTTMDSGGSIVEGEIEHLSRNTLRVTFLAAFSGDAYLS